MTRLLVVAPSAGIRNSLRFALEAEGYDVTAAPSLHAVDRSVLPYDCVVLDHHTIAGLASYDRGLLAPFGPVILLANSPAHPLAFECFQTLTKPTLWPALSEAVRAAVAARGAT